MKEKERYELREVFEDGFFYWYLRDNDTKLLEPLIDLHNCVYLLNQQDAKIKELESKLRISNSQLASSELKYEELDKNYKKQEDLLSVYLKNCSELNLENQQLKEKLEEKDKVIEMQKSIKRYDIGEMLTENTKLKQQLHSQPREIVEKIKSKMDNVVDTLINLGNGKEDAIAWFCGILEEILKEYGGEE